MWTPGGSPPGTGGVSATESRGRGGRSHRTVLFALEYRDPYQFKDIVNIVTNRLILEPHDLYAAIFQIRSPLRIALYSSVGKVRSAIQLDREPTFRAIKVDNVRANAELSAKLFARYLSSP